MTFKVDFELECSSPSIWVELILGRLDREDDVGIGENILVEAEAADITDDREEALACE